MAQQEKWLPGTECMAKFNFAGATAEYLSFKKGEIVFITKPTKDPNWYHARNERGQVGFIPANYVQKRERVKRNLMPPDVCPPPKRRRGQGTGPTAATTEVNWKDVSMSQNDEPGQ